MKRLIILSCLAIATGLAQEKNAGSGVNRLVTYNGAARQYAPSDVKILGIVDYGKPWNSVDQRGGPRYRALVFCGHGGDRVQITLKGTSQKAFFALADSTLNQIGSGAASLSLSLPYRGPDIEVYYILFPASATDQARVSVEVKKTGNSVAEMKATMPESARQTGLE